MARRKPPPPRPEAPARIRVFDPANWPDPVDWLEDLPVVRRQTRSWSAMRDDEARMAWWRSERPEYRADVRHRYAWRDWCDANDVDPLEVLEEMRAVRLATFHRREDEP